MKEKNLKHKLTCDNKKQNGNTISFGNEKFMFVDNEYNNSLNKNFDTFIQKNNSNNYKKNKKYQDIYIGYIPRIIINIILFILIFSTSLYLFIMSFSINEETVIKYQESSEIDYKVFLKDNSFYEDSYLKKDMSYVSSLIDNINTTFNYNFSIDKKIEAKFKYNIIGKLLIMDSTGDNVFYEKQYVLLDDKDVIINNANRCIINENLTINYPYYNSIANDFRNKFGVSTTSSFVVTMNISGETKEEKLNIGKGQPMSLTIPLSQREIRIKLSTNNQNNNESVVEESSIQIKNYWYLIIAIIVFIISIVLLIKLLKNIIMVNDTKSKYDKYVEKILKEYDRFIANTKIGPIVNDGDKVIKLNDFQELLDVRDSFKVPINYYNIVSHQKCVFYLNKDNLIYEYCVKAVDLENEYIKKDYK